MEKEKLIRAFKILVFILILVLTFTFWILPKLREDEVIFKPDEEGISTDIPFQSSDYNDGKLVQDYSNPTEDEKNMIEDIYGKDNVRFDSEGLHLINMGDVFEGDEDRLITSKWPDNDMTNRVLKPELDIYEVEVGETYLFIKIQNVSKRDLEKYIKKIKDDFPNASTQLHPKTIFRARDEVNVLVDIKFFKDTSEGTIEYYF